MQTIDLFPLLQQRPTLDQRVERAVAALRRLFHERRIAICQFSAGKDSGVVAALTLEAARRHAAEGGEAVVYVVTADTGVESPEIVAHAKRELAKMHAYGKRHNVRVHVQTVAPSLATSWQVTILSGRALPSYAGTNSDCSVSLKIEPSRVFRNQLARAAKQQGYAEPVVCLGSRFAESAKRKAGMQARGDRADTVGT
ncbi:hypothetical protein [Burkholderia multivorans]|uniref:hypothetical protein n=1 Tax=Burkholderia multivorans TaxID=87883 RepID=UPI0020B18F7F|nr:hypothetical protein [Burkholderia multivorans]